MNYEQYQEKRKLVNLKIKQALTWVGSLVAGLFSVVYIAILIILYFGMEHTKTDDLWMLWFGLIGAAVGLIIDIALTIQGVDLAKRDDFVEQVNREYYEQKTRGVKKEREYKTIGRYMITHTIFTISVKVSSVVGISLLAFKIVIEAANDPIILLLGISNLFMFIGFGLLSMGKSYSFYLEQHVPAIIEKTRRLKECTLDSSTISTGTITTQEFASSIISQANSMKKTK